VAPALNDVVAGHVSMTFGDFGTTLPLVRAGKLRALGGSSAQHVAAAPGILPLAGAGIPGFGVTAWQMGVAPAGPPTEILYKGNAEWRTIVGGRRFPEDPAGKGMTPLVTAPPIELQAYVRSEIARWSEVVKQAGVASSE